MFCYGFYPYATTAAIRAAHGEARGHGEKYRLTLIGPGVTPDVMWVGDGLPDYDSQNPALFDWERQMSAKVARCAPLRRDEVRH